MEILGAIVFMIMPYLAGYSCKHILRWKETNQIETYLIGFFFLFFLQGVILIPCVWLGKSLSFAGYICGIVSVLFAVFFVVTGFCRFLYYRKKEEAGQTARTPLLLPKKDAWKKQDRICFVLMMVVFILICVRMVLGMDILRDDIVLETVQSSLQTDTLFLTHPLTGRVMESGMIASKKIVTLPLFYACVASLTGLEAEVLLYGVVGILSLTASYYAGALLLSKVTVLTRGKLYLFWSIYGLLLLAGDYHPDTLAYRFLYEGYEGSTICFGIILPYLLYIVASWYKEESEEEKTTISVRFMYVLKMALGFAVSVVVTGLGTGFVFLFMSVVLAGICCLFKSIKEVRACKES